MGVILKIELGEEIKVDVAYKGKTYVLREPTVDEVESISDNNQSGDKLRISEFLVKLGLPSEVVKSMGASKASTLIERLMDLITKKK